jgi:acetylornithine deacetylase/succinyl-diaminopimelate desuccinylase-like protein
MPISAADDQATIHQRPVELLQNLIRFNTTNPPGNEGECIAYISHLLNAAGIETTHLALDPARPNLIARLTGQGNAPGLLLQGHVDVVTVENQTWQYPPFEGKLIDGYVWGRGALDMKGGVAMMLAAFLRAKAEGIKPAGDVVLAILCDEEAGSDHGSKYLAENYPKQFKGIRYAIGEVGGFCLYVGKKRFYPIMVAEKQLCWTKVYVRGPGGHAGIMPIRGGTMARLARILQRLDEHPQPVRITPVARQMIQTIASALPFPSSLILRQLLNPMLADRVLKLLGNRGRTFEPTLRNIVNATIVRGGEKINVIPTEIVVEVDARVLPGYSADEFMDELRHIIGDDVEVELTRFDTSSSTIDMGLFSTLADILCEADPNGIPVPLLFPGVTDGRFFSKLGIHTYGFIPMNLPSDISFMQLAHGPDERVPVEAINFGTDAIYKLLQRLGK